MSDEMGAGRRIAVVGRGLMGAAAARHLTRMGASVALIGPDEPTGDWAAHPGPFASHYDEGRITRRMAHDALWTRLSTAAIERYAEIEAASGLRVFRDVGAVMSGPSPETSPHGADGFMGRVAAVVAAERVAADRLDGAALRDRFPAFRFPAERATAFHEPKGAGHISPRRMVRAQTVAATAAGATLVSASATAVRDLGAGVEVETATGETVSADIALVAAGGFSVDPRLGTGPLDLSVYARTVSFFALDAAQAEALAAMPTVIWHPENDAFDWYLLPPILYPDGETYLKLGGEKFDARLETAEEMADWFRSGGRPQISEAQEAAVRAFLPDLEIAETRYAPCVTSWTAHGRPYIGPGESPRIIALTGGNGAGAKCSDELGRLGARAALGAPLDPERYPDGFEPVFR